MPYLVKVGYYVQEDRLTSQGYFIKRMGTRVYTKWGGIYVKSNPTVKFFWKNYSVQNKTHKLSSTDAAKGFMKKKIEFFLKRRFDKLPSGYVIRSRNDYDI